MEAPAGSLSGFDTAAANYRREVAAGCGYPGITCIGCLTDGLRTDTIALRLRITARLFAQRCWLPEGIGANDH
jgi:hypothetical protein